jgi:predicted aldo/keto reductase-like oxidoreductase
MALLPMMMMMMMYVCMFQHQENVDTMMDDHVEPLNDEMSLPAVESHSIPVIEELDPIVEYVEKSQTPVVEEPIIATHTYCTGCPTDIDVSNPALQDYVDQALAVIDEGSRGKYMHRATRIAKAQKQV